MAKPAFDHNGTTTTAIKFLCSYGGKILPRYPDGKLRYVGGHTRVLAVNRSISFSELLLKLEDMCGAPVSLRCQLPSEDLDALVSIKSDEDLANLIEEYDHLASFPSVKIRAFLSMPTRSDSQQAKISSPRSSDASSPTSPTSPCSISSSAAAVASTSYSKFAVPVVDRCIHQGPAPVMAFPFRSAGKVPKYAYRHHGNPHHIYFTDNGSQWK